MVDELFEVLQIRVDLLEQLLGFVAEIRYEFRFVEKIVRHYSTPNTERSGVNDPVSGIRMNCPDTCFSLSRKLLSIKKTS